MTTSRSRRLPFHAPARLADGLGFESNPGAARAPLAPLPELSGVVPPLPDCASPELGCAIGMAETQKSVNWRERGRPRPQHFSKFEIGCDKSKPT